MPKYRSAVPIVEDLGKAPVKPTIKYVIQGFARCLIIEKQSMNPVFISLLPSKYIVRAWRKNYDDSCKEHNEGPANAKKLPSLEALDEAFESKAASQIMHMARREFGLDFRTFYEVDLMEDDSNVKTAPRPSMSVEKWYNKQWAFFKGSEWVVMDSEEDGLSTLSCPSALAWRQLHGYRHCPISCKRADSHRHSRLSGCPVQCHPDDQHLSPWLRRCTTICKRRDGHRHVRTMWGQETEVTTIVHPENGLLAMPKEAIEDEGEDVPVCRARGGRKEAEFREAAEKVIKQLEELMERDACRLEAYDQERIDKEETAEANGT